MKNSHTLLDCGFACIFQLSIKFPSWKFIYVSTRLWKPKLWNCKRYYMIGARENYF